MSTKRVEAIRACAEIAASNREPGAALTAYLDVLESLSVVGRYRLYRIAHDPFREPAEQGRLFLTATVDGDSDLLGYSIPLDESTWSTARSAELPFAPVFGEPATDPHRWPRYVVDLDLEHKRWLDVPLRANGVLQGLLAVDWDQSERGPNETTRNLIQIVCSSVANTLSEMDSTLGARMVGRIQALYESTNAHSEEDVVKAALEAISETFDLGHGSAFKLDPTDGSILRFLDTSTTDPPPERYDSKDRLTGKAWSSPDFRFIPDFNSVPAELINTANQAWLTEQYGGQPRSVTYLRLGTHSQRYLLRFISCSPIDYQVYFSEASAVHAASARLDALADAGVASRRRSSLEEVTKGGLAGANRHVSPSVLGAFDDEGLMPFVLAISNENYDSFVLREVHRTAPDGSDTRVRGPRSCDADLLYRRGTALTKPLQVELSQYPHSSIALSLKTASNSEHAVVVPIAFGSTLGVILIPTPEDDLTSLGRGLDPDTLEYIASLGRLVAQGLENRIAQAVSEGANRALGVIGHEISTPISIYQSSANEAVTFVRASLQELAEEGGADPIRLKELDNQLRNSSNRLTDEARSIETAMTAARSVASTELRSIRAHFRSASIPETVNRATATLSREASRSLNIIRLDSLTGLPYVVHDPSLLRMAFLNILRNAAKFSDSGSRVRIWAETQKNYVDIFVENFGPGIPEDLTELVFGPFVRADDFSGETGSNSPEEAGGLGVGLYVARAFTRAHGGDLTLTRGGTDSFTRLSGVRTVFRVRIRRRLKPGTWKYDFDPSSMAGRRFGGFPPEVEATF